MADYLGLSYVYAEEDAAVQNARAKMAIASQSQAEVVDPMVGAFLLLRSPDRL